jgi:hypothetical protein
MNTMAEISAARARRCMQAVGLKQQGLDYIEIGVRMEITLQRARQLVHLGRRLASVEADKKRRRADPQQCYDFAIQPVRPHVMHAFRMAMRLFQVDDMRDIARLTDDQLLAVKGVGQSVLREIRAAQKEIGL